MAMTDDDLVRQLEAVPLVESPDFRDAVMGRIRRAGSPAGWAPAKSRRYVDRRFALALAWAAAVVIVIGVGLWRAPQPQNTAATMAQSDFSVSQSGDRIFIKTNVKGDLEWDPARLSKVQTLPDGTVVFRRRPGATGFTEIRLRVAGGEVLKTSIRVD
jgi:hypothetical protein